MSDYKKTTLTYTELLTTISEIQLVFYASMYGNCRLLHYLKDEHNIPDLLHDFKLRDADNNGEQHYKREYLLNAVESASKHFNRDYSTYIQNNLFEMVNRLTKENLIVNTYELIKNYSDHNPELLIMPHLNKIDWFQMLHFLRRNAAHFGNIGKKLNWPQGYPNPVQWDNLIFYEGIKGHEINYKETYAMKLVKHCRKYIVDNETIFSKS